MLNKEQSKKYEKYLMKKKAELLEYLRRQAVNLGKFTSMGEYLDKLKKEEKLCVEGDATRLYQSVYAALSRYFDRHRQGDDFLYDSLSIHDTNDAIAYLFGKKLERNKVDIVELIGQLRDGIAEIGDGEHYMLLELHRTYLDFLETRILHIQLLTGHKLIASEDQFCIKNATINAGGVMIINYQCELEGKIVDKVLWLGARYLSMNDVLLKKNLNKSKMSTLGNIKRRKRKYGKKIQYYYLSRI